MPNKLNKYIIAIGGGDVGKGQTLAIDQEIVKLTKKSRPKLLFIPTASSDDANYIQAMKKTYGKKLRCQIDTLLLIKEKPSIKTIEEKISSADIIYVGGGNTLMMMKLWRKLGIDKMLKSAYNKGTIMCGISAGAICWYEYGHSDSMSFYNPKKWKYICVKGLGLIKGTVCPHYDGQTGTKKRKNDFQNMIKKIGGLGIGIENCCAIKFTNNAAEIIKSKSSAKAFQIYKQNKKILVKGIV